MNAVLSHILLLISNALLTPVMLALIVFASITVAWLGGLIAEANERRRHSAKFRALIDGLKCGEVLDVEKLSTHVLFGYPRRMILRLLNHTTDKELDDLQLVMDSALARISLGIRLGPILGLMGTLIPLGPALIAMSGGDIHALTGKLVVAFTTTVTGLAIGGVNYVTYTIRHRWYAQDLSDLEFIAGKVSRQ